MYLRDDVTLWYFIVRKVISLVKPYDVMYELVKPHL